MAVAHDQATMELIKTRLSHSERPLIRLIRTFYKLSSSTVNERTQKESIEEIKILHFNFLIELKYLIKSLKEFKGNKFINLNQSELKQLELNQVNLEQNILDEKFKIKQLELSLDQVRKQRKNKILYEEIGKEVRRFSDRFQSADRINGLAREIQSLLDEQGFYAERWASRRAQFDTVISNLEVLQESIKEEKADADRKKALNDDESDDGNIAEEVVEGGAGNATGGGEEGVEEESEKITKETSGGGLNPNAASFHPISADQQQQQQSSQATTPDDRMKLDDNNLIEKRGQPMEIDGIDTNQLTAGDNSCEDGLILDEATMEDGEEIEEAEEGEEMEHES